MTTSGTATASRIETAYRERFPKSAELAARAREVFPDGVTHDGRNLAPFPVYVASSAGARKTTVEGHELIDFWSGHGALLLGHGHPAVVEAVQRQMALGTHWSACHELELRWGELVRELVPSAETVRFTNSGTEATLMAIRIARLVTGRRRVLKFAGHFHGWHDQLILGAYPPHDTLEHSAHGITDAVRDDLVIVPPNDPAALARALVETQPACAILEPTGGRWGTVPVRGPFLRDVRELTAEHDVPLIFDEVITGFRVHPGGAQAAYGVTPDLTTLAKVLAGGLPGGCLAGRADLMDALATENRHGRKMPHHGTYNANPVSAAAGIAALEVVRTGEPSEHASRLARTLRSRFNEVFSGRDVPLVAYGDFSMVRLLPGYRGPRPEADDFVPYEGDHERIDRPIEKSLTHAFRCAMLLNGVDWMSWGGMTNAAMTEADVDATVAALDAAVEMLAEDGHLA